MITEHNKKLTKKIVTEASGHGRIERYTYTLTHTKNSHEMSTYNNDVVHTAL